MPSPGVTGDICYSIPCLTVGGAGFIRCQSNPQGTQPGSKYDETRLVIRISTETGLVQQQVLDVGKKPSITSRRRCEGRNVELRNFGVLKSKSVKPAWAATPMRPQPTCPSRALRGEIQTRQEMREEVIKLPAAAAIRGDVKSFSSQPRLAGRGFLLSHASACQAEQLKLELQRCPSNSPHGFGTFARFRDFYPEPLPTPTCGVRRAPAHLCQVA